MLFLKQKCITENVVQQKYNTVLIEALLYLNTVSVYIDVINFVSISVIATKIASEFFYNFRF